MRSVRKLRILLIYLKFLLKYSSIKHLEVKLLKLEVFLGMLDLFEPLSPNLYPHRYVILWGYSIKEKK